MSGRGAMGEIQGTPVVGGTVYAPAVWARRVTLPAGYPASGKLSDAQIFQEVAGFERACEYVARALEARAEGAQGAGAEMLYMNAAMARDPQWGKAVIELIERGRPAYRAVIEASDEFAEMLRGAGDVAADRCSDLLDVRDRVLARLLGQPEPGLPVIERESVLFAEDLAPADTATLDPRLVRAIVTAGGGPTSHTSVIARQMGIACIVGAPVKGAVHEGDLVLVDGRAGTVRLGVSEGEAQAAVAEYRAREERIRDWRGPARLADGRELEVLVNLQDIAGLERAGGVPAGASGIGLFRTELPFITSVREPSVAEQEELYYRVFRAAAGRRVVIRTLDAGSDKPLSWVNPESEDNPALGMRGIRAMREHGCIHGALVRQLDAIVAASRRCPEAERAGHWVMAPMISTVGEARDFAGLVHERGLQAGIMVEVPAVAMIAERFLEVVDFVSIGTNDLTQYVMAADRNNPRLTGLLDNWQPAVLNMVDMVVHAGRCTGKPVGVCGEAAADPLMAAVLVGMGVSSLSMAPGAIPWVGVELEEYSLEDCARAAQAVLQSATAHEARAEARRLLRGE